MLGDFEEALTSAQRSVGLKPDWAKGYYRAGEAELELNHFDRARAYFEKVAFRARTERHFVVGVHILWV
jgi:tetratricopeptide (TPR) repeat protein